MVSYAALSHPTQVNAADVDGDTALIAACNRGTTAVAKLLLAREDVEVRLDSSSIVF